MMAAVTIDHRENHILLIYHEREIANLVPKAKVTQRQPLTDEKDYRQGGLLRGEKKEKEKK